MVITITEPLTMLTDYIIAVETLVFAVSLFRIHQDRQQISICFCAAAFLTIAIAAIFGGTYHGFTLYFDEKTKVILWIPVVYSLSLSSLLMLQATVISSLNNRLHKLLFIVISLKSIIYLYLSANKDDFKYVIADYLSAMVVILIFQGWNLYRRQDKSAIWIIFGVLVSFIAAGVQQSGFIFAENFNHNDLSHIISMVAFYLLYKGFLLLKDW